MTASMQRLFDKEDIRDVLYRYARSIDRLDAELLQSVFWPDGGFEDGMVDGPASDFVPGLIAAVGSMFVATQHSVSNIRIEFDGPNVAFTESYFIAFHLLDGKEPGMTAMLGARRVEEMGGDRSGSYELYVGGRYFDRFEMRGGSWRIAKRRFVADWTSCGPDSGVGRNGFTQLWKLRGSRDRTDPSYSRRDIAKPGGDGST